MIDKEIGMTGGKVRTGKKIKTVLLSAMTVTMLALASCGKSGNESIGDKNQRTEAETKAGTEAETEASSDDGNSDNSDRTEKEQREGEPSTQQEGLNEQEKSEEQIEQEQQEESEMSKAATLMYQGHASMRITTYDGNVIYIDPFMGTGYDKAADLILITHGHYDHTQTDLIENKNEGCQTITWKEALKDGEHQSFDLGFVSVEAVEAGYNNNHDVKECVGYILTFENGVTLYLSGDTSTTQQMSELADRNLDYAFFCCDGVYNMDVNEASECAKLVNAKHSIPYHMIPGNNSNGFDIDVAESFDAPGRIIIAPGEELVLE